MDMFSKKRALSLLNATYQFCKTNYVTKVPFVVQCATRVILGEVAHPIVAI